MQRKLFASLLIILASSQGILAAYCSGKPNPNAKPNLNVVQTDPPQFMKSVKNGRLFTVGRGDELVHVVHVWGTPYEMGHAHGELMTEQAHNFMTDVWNYLEEQVEEAINGTTSIFPAWFLQDVADLGLDAALDAEIVATERFTGGYFLEEIKGLGDSCGVDYKKIQRIHLIGELTKGHCSMFGANSSATPTGGLLQLRALDWNVDGPFKNYPQVTVYHPNLGNGHAFANVGWTGWVGSITGMSSTHMAICEIGVSYPDDTFGKESRFGIPFTYILRDILQFDSVLDAAVERLKRAHRTCDLILGVGDGKTSSFRGVEYSAAVANFFTWDNLRPEASWHPKIKDVVYWGMDWLCPGYSEVLARQLQTYHGKLTPSVAIQEIVPIVQTGDLHIAIYDFVNNLMFISNARGDGESGPTMAYDRPFIKLDMTALFNIPRPAV